MKNNVFTRLLESLKYNKKLRIGVAGILVAAIVVAGIKIAGNKGSKNEAYRETTVTYGNLTVGITESGTIDIGTIEQEFELDMSQLTRVSTSNSGSTNSSAGGMGGMSFGGDMSGGMSMGGGSSQGGSSSGASSLFGQMFDLGGSSSSTSSSNSDSKLVVESIEVSVGQQISKGDVILKLESAGVDELKAELESNVEKASADLEALIADQKLSTTTAEYTLNSNLKYGSYAETEKNSSLTSLKETMESAQSSLETAQATLATYEEQLATAKADYENAVVVMNNAIAARDSVDKDTQLYWYCQYFNSANSAISNAESLKSKVEQLESKIESTKSTIEKYKTNLAKAKRNYATGLLSAQQTYDLRMLAYNTAQETYDITISYLEDDLAEQQATYEKTKSKWDEFTSYIDGVNILSEYDGVVTDISLAAGDKLSTGTVVITLYDAEAVTMTVSVDENDMTNIELGGLANINLTAYPEDVFEATITEIGDASSDSNGNTTYDVTVTIKGDVSKLFQGMTGNVTFITKQNSDVLYVNNRAIIRENGTSYVKVKKANGSIDKVKVVTGFSDGVNVQIVSGLEEGQTVIIEKGDN